jgi:AcrR family transcriptional regulator
MKNWPLNTSMDAFRQAWILEGEQFWHSVFEMHKDKMQIKNPKVAIVNLEKIFTATFKLANAKGFQAMSLRDLSRETGISMGGLYAYIGSKNDLASVIEGVLRNYIDQVIGGLAGENLDPVDRLKAIIFGEIYMMQILNPWYYFCFMELKGLDRAQQEQAMELELRFERILIDAFKAGIERGDFNCARPEIQAAMVTAQLQQWHLKHWKFRLRKVGMDEYAQYIYDNLLLGLGASDKSDSAPMVKLA